MTSTLLSALTAHLRKEEGEVLHAYQDHLGFWTIGVGRLIDAKKGGGISQKESAFLLANDLTRLEEEFHTFLPWIGSLSEPRQAVLYSMAFQMGLAGLLKFKNTLEAIREGNWEKAAKKMKVSLWYEQTPARAERLIKQLVTGEWNEE